MQDSHGDHCSSPGKLLFSIWNQIYKIPGHLLIDGIGRREGKRIGRKSLRKRGDPQGARETLEASWVPGWSERSVRRVKERGWDGG